MENATKALLIAAGVLIGMLILSLAVYLYYSLGEYVEIAQKEMEFNALNKFNNQFLKYNNVKKNASGVEEIEFKLTIQDIITVANIAYENNQKNNLTEEYSGNPKYFYVKVSAKLYKPDGTSVMFNNLENNVNENSEELLSTYKGDYNYKCSSSDVLISEETGRVYSITFK